MSAAPRLRMTAAEFSEWELRQEHRHEYHRGEVFPMHRGPDGMAGGTETHARIITNTLLALTAALGTGTASSTPTR